jgi:peptide chain release factor 2
VTAKQCRFDYYRCPGNGGQKVNKTSSGVRCTHPPSGAVGQSCDTRVQYMNKRTAFERMAKSKEFQCWNKREISRVTGEIDRIQKWVNDQRKKVRVEVKEEGKWVEVGKDEKLDMGDTDG